MDKNINKNKEYPCTISESLFSIIKNTFIEYLAGIATINNELVELITPCTHIIGVNFIEGLNNYQIMSKSGRVYNCHYTKAKWSSNV